MPNLEDIKKLAIIRLRLRGLTPESRNVITADMQWLADELFEAWQKERGFYEKLVATLKNPN